MNKILAPVDFSPTSLHAAHYACVLAKNLNAALYLVHVLELGHEKLYQPFTLHEKYNNLMIDERKEELLTLQNELQGQYNIKIETQLLTGSVTEAMLKFSRTNEVDLLVMGSSGMGKATRFLMGSVAEHTIRVSNIPVVTVPAQSKLQVPGVILFATSHYEENEKLLNPLVSLARAFNAAVRIIFFHDIDSDNTYYIDNAKKQEKYHSFLNSKYNDVDFEVEILEGKNFVDTIEAYEKEKGADMVALVPYAKSFFEKLRSTTSKIAFHSSIPVLVLPSIEEDRKEDHKISSTSKI
jgi:nucleotide-binding universal stress UspA family protein